MTQNRFKSDTNEQDSPIKERKKKQKKSGSKSNKFSGSFKKVNGFIQNEKTQQVTGLFFILFSAYLLIAFTSFLFTWKIDQSKVELPFGEYMFNPELLVENWLGKLGAWISHIFISGWFGISSFLFVGLSFLIRI